MHYLQAQEALSAAEEGQRLQGGGHSGGRQEEEDAGGRLVQGGHSIIGSPLGHQQEAKVFNL